MTLEERITFLNDLGYTVTPDDEYRGKVGSPERKSYDLPGTVEAVYLNFTDEEWVRMCQRERDWYIGPCCGNTGLVQDVMAVVFRDGGSIDAADLLRIGPLISGHDGWEWTRDLDVDAALDRMANPTAEAPPEDAYYAHDKSVMPPWLDPWDRVCVIYAALEPALKPSKLYDMPKTPYTAYGSLVSAVRYIDYSDLFTDRADGEHYEAQSEDVKAQMRDGHGQSKARHALAVAKIVGPLKAVAEQIEQEPVFEGYALVKPDTDEVLENFRGPCIYVEREGAERMIELWSRLETQESARRKNGEDVHEPEYVSPEAEIVKVRIDPRTGLEVLR